MRKTISISYRQFLPHTAHIGGIERGRQSSYADRFGCSDCSSGRRMPSPGSKPGPEEKIAKAAHCSAAKRWPTPEKRGGLKGSTEHWPAVYPPEFEIPKFVVAGY